MAQGDLLLVDQPRRKVLVEHQAEDMDGAGERMKPFVGEIWPFRVVFRKGEWG